MKAKNIKIKTININILYYIKSICLNINTNYHFKVNQSKIEVKKILECLNIYFYKNKQKNFKSSKSMLCFSADFNRHNNIILYLLQHII